MNIFRWWSKRTAPKTAATPTVPEIARLEQLAEQAYGAMYDTPPLSSSKDAYEDACINLQKAIDEAQRLDLADEVARLSRRLAHIRAVYDSQFRGF
jgi:hypothetical protein